MQFEYTPYYCEENAYLLAARLLESMIQTQVILISNQARSCLMLNQKAAIVGQPVFWDYHVIVMTGLGEEAYIWDLDTRLNLPCSVVEYVQSTFPSDIPLANTSLFKKIDAKCYVRTFSSDRRHMQRSDGTWIKPPPQWPPLIGPDAASQHELDTFLEIGPGFLPQLYLKNVL